MFRRENVHARYCHADFGERLFRASGRLHFSLRQIVSLTMPIDFILGGAVAALLLAYLVYALVRPEKF
jgi:K+-transporting ATPase KdpF subunit